MTERSSHSPQILFLDAESRIEKPRSRCAASACSAESATSLGEFFATSALNRGDAFALTTAAGTSTYLDLLVAALTVRDRLQSSSSFHPGDRVALLLSNSLDYIAAFYGSLMAGAVVVPLAPRIERTQFLSVLQSTAASHVITQPRFARSWIDALGGAAAESLCLNHDAAPDSSSTVDFPADSLAAIFFTGGSSGTPKGVMLSHRNLMENARSIQQYLNIQSDDRPLCVLPFYHAFGNSVLQSHVLAGSHLILDGNPTFPQTLIESILKHQATSLSGVPDLFRFLLERSSLESLQHSSLRYMAVAGGALPHELAKSVARRIHPARFFVMYGQTEATARLAYVPPDRFSHLGSGCIGRAVPGVELQIVDEHENQVPPGIVGEIRARGPNIMLGYWGDQELTAETLRDGWLYTGDLGSFDAEGWIYHRGSRNALIKIAGYRMHPSDVENFVTRELPIQQAVLVPFEQPGLGTRLALYARPHPDAKQLTTREVVACCRDRLPRHMVPDLVQFLDEFPLNDAMKIDRPRLMKLAAEIAVQHRKAV